MPRKKNKDMKNKMKKKSALKSLDLTESVVNEAIVALKQIEARHAQQQAQLQQQQMQGLSNQPYTGQLIMGHPQHGKLTSWAATPGGGQVLTSNGQWVSASSLTQFDPVDLNKLNPGDLVTFSSGTHAEVTSVEGLKIKFYPKKSPDLTYTYATQGGKYLGDGKIHDMDIIGVEKGVPF